jgi:two-component system response regulator VicR
VRALPEKILVVEDEKPIADILKFKLENEGYLCFCASDGQEALEKFFALQPDLVLLDLMLPKIDGLEVCKQIRQNSSVPVIILTAKDSEIDKVLGLELGADDYVTKPFSNRELLARIRAKLRRKNLEQADYPSLYQVGELTIDAKRFVVVKRGQAIYLTQREFELLLYLARNAGHVFSRKQLLQAVWGYEQYGDERTVDVTIRRLREKIEDDPANPKYLVTRRRLGYVLREC